MILESGSTYLAAGGSGAFAGAAAAGAAAAAQALQAGAAQLGAEPQAPQAGAAQLGAAPQLLQVSPQGAAQLGAAQLGAAAQHFGALTLQHFAGFGALQHLAAEASPATRASAASAQNANMTLRTISNSSLDLGTSIWLSGGSETPRFPTNPHSFEQVST